MGTSDDRDFSDARSARTGAPRGTVTFLFTDIEGSTRLWQAFPAAMKDALARHHALLQQAIDCHNGYVFQIVGDAICAAFHTAHEGVAAALVAQRALKQERWRDTGPLRVRMALHTGTAEFEVGAYKSGEYASGLTLSRVARLLAAGHGDQILVSHATEQLAREQLPPGIEFRDLGERRLRDLTRAAHVFQLVGPDLVSDFPPLKSLDLLPNNLPVQVTSFVGREREIGEATAVLAERRLLTLLGPGGTGKTRLSLQVAANLVESFADGVWFIELAPLSDAALLPQTVASALSVREEADRPLLTTIVEHLRDRTLLLILDNCEHLIVACARLTDELLRGCPKLRILASSREALGVTAEAVLRVPPLSLPDAQHTLPLQRLAEYEAVRLLVERGKSIKPTFAITDANATAMVQICRRLDGIPLAIELAAARLKAFSVQEIAAHLDQRFRLLTGGNRVALPRHQTLKGLIDWSYELLSETERILLRRLAVFAGHWNLTATEAICSGEGVAEEEVLDLLSRLVDKSLVVVDEEDGETRYGLLETIRQYGTDKLRESTEEARVRDRHRGFYLGLAENAERHLHGGDQAGWLRRLEDAHDNLRAALAWSVESRDIEGSLRFGASLGPFWDTHGHISEGRGWLERILAKAEREPVAPTRSSRWTRVKAIDAAALMVLRQSEFARAKELYIESLALWREIGDPSGTAEALNNLGDLFRQLGDRQQAKSLVEESLALFRQLADKRGIAHALNNLADILMIEGNHAEAKRLFEESVPLFRQIEDKRGLSHGLNNLGGILAREGDYGEAERFYRESFRLGQGLDDKHAVATAQRSLGEVARHQGRYPESVGLYRESVDLLLQLNDKYCAGKSLLGLGWVAHDTGDVERAGALGQQAVMLFRELQVRAEVAAALNLLGRVALAAGRLEPATELLRESFDVQRSMQDMRGMAITLEDLARVAGAQGDATRMVKLLAAATGIRQANGVSSSAVERHTSEDAVAVGRAALDHAAFTSAWAEGATLTLEEAIALTGGASTGR